MTAELCIQTFHSSGGTAQAGDIADSATSIVSTHPTCWELVTPASSSIAIVSVAYANRVINRGDVLLTSDAAVVACPKYFITADGGAAYQAARRERLGAHR